MEFIKVRPKYASHQSPKQGGMLERVFHVVLKNRTLRVRTHQIPDGKFEQYQVTPQS